LATLEASLTDKAWNAASETNNPAIEKAYLPPSSTSIDNEPLKYLILSADRNVGHDTNLEAALANGFLISKQSELIVSAEDGGGDAVAVCNSSRELQIGKL
jgi:hypothetical protein